MHAAGWRSAWADARHMRLYEACFGRDPFTVTTRTRGPVPEDEDLWLLPAPEN